MWFRQDEIHQPHRGVAALAHRKESSSRRRGLSQSTVSKDPVAMLLPSLAGFLGDGSITLGIVKPAGCVATAADGYNCLVMLVRRQDETLTELLLRLDYAIRISVGFDP